MSVSRLPTPAASPESTANRDCGPVGAQGRSSAPSDARGDGARVGAGSWLVPAGLLAAAALLIVGVIAAAVPSELPARVWSHPGDPWCDACRAGVPCATFRLAPDGPIWDPGWCFNDVDRGLRLGPPTTPFVELVNSIEADFRCGEFTRWGGATYARTGRVETSSGHRWTEYVQVESR